MSEVSAPWQVSESHVYPRVVEKLALVPNAFEQG